MKRISAVLRAGTVMLAVAIVPALHARSCGSNGDLVGSFGWLATRTSQFVAVPVLPPGTAVGSSSPIGGLVAGAVNNTAFASVGRVFLDGNGTIFATPTSGGVQTSVGTYNVNGDCTVSVTLVDAFQAPAATAIAPAQVSATFEGVVVSNGNEIDLTQTGASAGTTIILRKTRQSCTTSDVFDSFGISAGGLQNGATTASFNILGRFVADGAGNLVEDATGQASPLTNRKITGSYTVNSDCTGTLSLITADGKKRAANLVIVTKGSDLSSGQQALQFAFTDPGVVGSGGAEQQ